MRYYLQLFIIFFVFFLMNPIDQTGSLCLSNLYAQSNSAQMNEGPVNYVFFTIYLLISLAGIWFCFYSFVYPRLLNYYHDDYAKKLFWSMIRLYVTGWFCYSAYMFFHFYRIRIAVIFFGGIWLVHLLFLHMKDDSDYEEEY